MKKSLCILLILFSSFNSLTIVAQNSNVSSKLNDSLLVRYPEAEKIEWSIEDSSSLNVANFVYFKKNICSKYNDHGVWVSSITEVNQREVHYLVINYLKDKYLKDISNSIDKILMFEQANKETYYIALIKTQKVKARVQVYFTLSGKFIKAIEPKEFIEKNAPKSKESQENMMLNDVF